MLCTQSKPQELPAMGSEPLSNYQSLLGAHSVGKTPLNGRRSSELLHSAQDPGDTSDSSFHAANGLLREPVSRNWPLVCLELLARWPEVEDWQETAEPAALETPEGVASLSAPLRFRVEETERSARWRPLHPGTLAGLADWSPKGTEERRAQCYAVYPARPQRGLPS